MQTDDGPVLIRDHGHLGELKQRANRSRVDSDLDVPVTPEFAACCGADRFAYRELDRC